MYVHVDRGVSSPQKYAPYVYFFPSLRNYICMYYERGIDYSIYTSKNTPLYISEERKRERERKKERGPSISYTLIRSKDRVKKVYTVHMSTKTFSYNTYVHTYLVSRIYT